MPMHKNGLFQENKIAIASFLAHYVLAAQFPIAGWLLIFWKAKVPPKVETFV